MKKNEASRADWIIAPDGQRTYAVAHAKATVRGDSTVDADLSRLEKKIDGSGRFTVTNAVVNQDAWTETADGEAEAVIPVTGVTDRTVALIYVDPSDSDIAIQCGLKSRCASGKGTITIYARIAPNDIIRLTILAMFSQIEEIDVEVTNPEAPTIAYYKLPVATADTLGGVKIGRNIDVADDGTISAKGGSCNHVLSGGVDDGWNHKHDEECIKDLVASSEEVEDALNRALGIDDEPDEQELTGASND